MLDPDIIGAEFRQGSSEIVGSNPAPRDQDVSAGRGFFSGLPCFRAVCLQGRNLHEKRQGFSSRPLCRNSVCYGCRHYRTRLRWWPGVVLHSAMGDPRCPLHNRSGYELEEAGLGNEQEDHLRERFLFRHDSCILVFLWRNRLLVSPKIPPRALHASPPRYLLPQSPSLRAPRPLSEDFSRGIDDPASPAHLIIGRYLSNMVARDEEHRVLRRPCWLHDVVEANVVATRRPGGGRQDDLCSFDGQYAAHLGK